MFLVKCLHFFENIAADINNLKLKNNSKSNAFTKLNLLMTSNRISVEDVSILSISGIFLYKQKTRAILVATKREVQYCMLECTYNNMY